MSTNLLVLIVALLIILAFGLGLTIGILYEKRQESKRDKDEPLAPPTPYKRVRPTVPRFDFGNQLDPIVPEPTLRPLAELEKVEKTEVDDE